MPAMETISLAALQSALKIDRTRIDLAGDKPETLKVTNTLPGLASLSVACPDKRLSDTGITATFDKTELKGNETAILTLTASPNAKPGHVSLQIIISPTNQTLNFTVNVSR